MAYNGKNLYAIMADYFKGDCHSGFNIVFLNDDLRNLIINIIMDIKGCDISKAKIIAAEYTGESFGKWVKV